MRDFFYQLTWDKELRQKFLSRSAIGAFALSIVFAICVVGYGNFTRPEQDDRSFKKQKEDSEFVLNFSEEAVLDNQEAEEAGQGGQEEGGNAGGGSGGNPGGGGGEPSHTHVWYTVVDSEPWDEEVWVQTGTKYICNACGFVCYDSGSASAHSAQTGHKFRTEGVFEKRVIHHAGTSHQECLCGARR